ncbi:MAG: TolC family protein [Bryobacteraceae bacterium]
MKNIVLVAASCAALAAETHTLSLRQTAELALKQSPEALLSRIDERKAALDTQVARDPFIPKVYAGSGLAYSTGFPMSIEGSAPSILQARGVASLYNKPQRLRIEQAKEAQRGAGLEGQVSREAAAYRAMELFLDLEHRHKLASLARRQVESARKVEEVTKVRVEEGRELPVEAKRAALELAKAEHRVAQLESVLDQTGVMLASALGFAPGDRVMPTEEERAVSETPESEDAAASQALANNVELRRLESALAAKGIAVQAERAARYPQIDLVAQYALLGKFNHYEDFFRKFQRHNGQFGMSIQVPLFLGSTVEARAAQAESEVARLRIETSRTRSRIQAETISRFHDLRNAEGGRKVARLDLDVARDQLSVELAKLDEGRSSLRQVEQLRMVEQEKWIAYWDAQHSVETARLALLERTGGLLASLR